MCCHQMLLVGLWEMPGYGILKLYYRLHLSEEIWVHGTYHTICSVKCSTKCSVKCSAKCVAKCFTKCSEGICMSEGKFIKPWQVTDKIIEYILMQFTFNILWVTLIQKIITCRVLKIHKWIHKWIWGDLYEWGKCY